MRPKPSLAIILCLLPILLEAQTSLVKRKYVPGDTYRYQLTCSTLHNGQWESTIVSVCELAVGKESNGVHFDEVRWIGGKKLSPEDTLDLTEKAIMVTPYKVSLEPEGKIDLPVIEVPEMTEPIQDLSTFLVAVSPQLGATELRAAGDTFTNKELIKADFSNGDFMLKGDDCFSVRLRATGVTRKLVTSEVDFLPPNEVCFPYLLDEMKVPVVKNTVNNFQMVQPSAEQRFNISYGREVFYIKTTTQRRDGKITAATMTNTLDLKLKMNCDQAYKNCGIEAPFVIQRNLTLELVDD